MEGFQKFLLNNFGFKCHCSICEKKGAELVEDDSLRQMIPRLEIESKLLISEGQYAFAEKLISIRLEAIEKLGLANDPAMCFTCCYDGFSSLYSHIEKNGQNMEDDVKEHFEAKLKNYLHRAWEYEDIFDTQYIADR